MKKTPLRTIGNHNGNNEAFQFAAEFEQATWRSFQKASHAGGNNTLVRLNSKRPDASFLI
jgi:hypothetical protein